MFKLPQLQLTAAAFVTNKCANSNQILSQLPITDQVPNQFRVKLKHKFQKQIQKPNK